MSDKITSGSAPVSSAYDDDGPIDPVMLRVQARLKRLMLIGGLTLGLGLLAVLGAIIYRISQTDSTGGAPPATLSLAALGLSADARLADSTVEGDRVTLTYADGGATVVLAIDLRSGTIIRRLTIGGGEVPREP